MKMRKSAADFDISEIVTKRRQLRRVKSPNRFPNMVEVISPTEVEMVQVASRNSYEEDPLEVRSRNSHRETSSPILQRTYIPASSLRSSSPTRMHPYRSVQSGYNHTSSLDDYNTYPTNSRIDQDSVEIILEELRNFHSAHTRALRGLESRLNTRLQDATDSILTELQGVRSDIIRVIENSTPAEKPLTSIVEFKNDINVRISNMEDKILKSLRHKPMDGSIPDKPSFIPFKTYEALIEFETSTKEEYDTLVQYLSNIGGWTAQSCMNSIFKDTVHDEALRNVSFTGYNKQMPFKDLKFAKACQEALRSNPKFHLDATVFADAASEALKASKQRERSKKARAQNRGGPKSNDQDDSTSSTADNNV